MLEELMEIAGLSAISGILFKIASVVANKEEQTSKKITAIESPQEYYNSAKDILQSYDKHFDTFTSAQIKRLTKTEFDHKIVYKVIVQDKLYTKDPHFITQTIPVLSTV